MHKQAIESRYAHFKNVFYYNSQGFITGINIKFVYKGQYVTSNYIEVVHYILYLLRYEKHHVEKITNVDELIHVIQMHLEYMPGGNVL